MFYLVVIDVIAILESVKSNKVSSNCLGIMIYKYVMEFNASVL